MRGPALRRLFPGLRRSSVRLTGFRNPGSGVPAWRRGVRPFDGSRWADGLPFVRCCGCWEQPENAPHRRPRCQVVLHTRNGVQGNLQRVLEPTCPHTCGTGKPRSSRRTCVRVRTYPHVCPQLSTRTSGVFATVSTELSTGLFAGDNSVPVAWPSDSAIPGMSVARGRKPVGRARPEPSQTNRESVCRSRTSIRPRRTWPTVGSSGRRRTTCSPSSRRSAACCCRRTPSRTSSRPLAGSTSTSRSTRSSSTRSCRCTRTASPPTSSPSPTS